MPSQSPTASRTDSLTRISPPSACRGHPRRHRDVAAEQVVAAQHRLAHVDADPHPNAVGALALVSRCMSTLHRTACSGCGEGDHEPVALALDDVAARAA